MKGYVWCVHILSIDSGGAITKVTQVRGLDLLAPLKLLSRSLTGAFW